MSKVHARYLDDSTTYTRCNFDGRKRFSSSNNLPKPEFRKLLETSPNRCCKSCARILLRDQAK